VLDGDQGFGVSQARTQAGVLGGQVGVLGAQGVWL
jgi:hypothetical protein